MCVFFFFLLGKLFNEVLLYTQTRKEIFVMYTLVRVCALRPVMLHFPPPPTPFVLLRNDRGARILEGTLKNLKPSGLRREMDISYDSPR